MKGLPTAAHAEGLPTPEASELSDSSEDGIDEKHQDVGEGKVEGPLGSHSLTAKKILI